MKEFQPLIENHKEVYKIVENLNSALETIDGFEILNDVKGFQKALREIIDGHFSTEERLILSKLPGKEADPESPIECVLKEHKYLIEKEALLSELIEKYEKTHDPLAYESLIQTAKSISSALYNHAYIEDSLLFAFSGIDLSEEEKNLVAKELAKVSCETCKKVA